MISYHQESNWLLRSWLTPIFYLLLISIILFTAFYAVYDLLHSNKYDFNHQSFVQSLNNQSYICEPILKPIGIE